jgi:hypothetical protein
MTNDEWYRKQKIKDYTSELEFYAGIGDHEKAKMLKELIWDLKTIPNESERMRKRMLRNYQEQMNFYESIGNWEEADKRHAAIYDLERGL